MGIHTWEQRCEESKDESLRFLQEAPPLVRPCILLHSLCICCRPVVPCMVKTFSGCSLTYTQQAILLVQVLQPKSKYQHHSLSSRNKSPAGVLHEAVTIQIVRGKGGCRPASRGRNEFVSCSTARPTALFLFARGQRKYMAIASPSILKKRPLGMLCRYGTSFGNQTPMSSFMEVCIDNE